MTPTPHPESVSTVETRELITLCRQMGSMMEAGVDILRVTRVLRAQTENPLLLKFYEAFDHDLRLGRSVADAMANAPDLFSPFAVSLVQEGEERNDIASALFKIADFLQSEEAIAEWSESGGQPETAQRGAADQTGAVQTAPNAIRRRTTSPSPDSGALQQSLTQLFERALRALAALLLVESGVAAAVAAGLVQPQWWPALAFLLAAGVFAIVQLPQRGTRKATELPIATPTPVTEVPVAPADGEPQGPAKSVGTAASSTTVATAGIEEKKHDWPTAEEEGTAFSKVWQRPAPNEEQYE